MFTWFNWSCHSLIPLCLLLGIVYSFAWYLCILLKSSSLLSPILIWNIVVVYHLKWTVWNERHICVCFPSMRLFMVVFSWLEFHFKYCSYSSLVYLFIGFVNIIFPILNLWNTFIWKSHVGSGNMICMKKKNWHYCFASFSFYDNYNIFAV